MSPEQRGELLVDAVTRDLADMGLSMDSLTLTSTIRSPVDWEGKPIPPDEPADKTIKVWETEPATRKEYDIQVTRSWRELKQILTDIQTDHLDSLDEDELREGFVFTVKLKEMTVGEYKEILDGND